LIFGGGGDEKGETNPGCGAGGFAKIGLKLLSARVGDLHNTIADDSGNYTTNHGECEEEGL